MIHYTEQITRLMRNIVSRVPALSFINLDEVLVFGRFGRPGAQGAFATCHSLTLPPTEPGHFFWRDRQTGRVTHCSEWFVTKTPAVRIDQKPISYLISFALPRFCDQLLEGSRKQTLYPQHGESWIAKLDTIVHELYHIDPASSGIRSFASEDGESAISHPPGFFEEVARMVDQYLATDPDPALCDFLRHSFSDLNRQFGGVVATTFSTFPSYPQRYMERLADQPALPRNVRIEPIKPTRQPLLYTEDHLHVRQFFDHHSRQTPRKTAVFAARTTRLHPPALACVEKAADL